MASQSAAKTPVNLTSKNVSSCVFNCNAEFIYENEFEWDIVAVRVINTNQAEDQRHHLIRFYVDRDPRNLQADLRWNSKNYQLVFFEFFLNSLHRFEGEGRAMEVCLCHKEMSESSNDWVNVSVLVEPSYVYNLSQDFFKRVIASIATDELYESQSPSDVSKSWLKGVAIGLTSTETLPTSPGICTVDTTSTGDEEAETPADAMSTYFRCASLKIDGAGRSKWTPYQLLPFDKEFFMYAGSCPYVEQLGISYGNNKDRTRETVAWIVMAHSVTIHFDEFAVLKKVFGKQSEKCLNYYFYDVSKIAAKKIRHNSGKASVRNASELGRDQKYFLKCDSQKKLVGKTTYARRGDGSGPVAAVVNTKDAESGSRGTLVFYHGAASFPAILLSVFFSGLIMLFMVLPAMKIYRWQNILMGFASLCLLCMLAVCVFISPMNIVMLTLGPLVIFANLLLNFAGKFVVRHEIGGAEYINLICQIAVAALLGLFASIAVVGTPMQFAYGSTANAHYYYLMSGNTDIKHEYEGLITKNPIDTITGRSEEDIWQGIRFFVGTKAVMDVNVLSTHYLRDRTRHETVSVAAQVPDGSKNTPASSSMNYAYINAPIEVTPASLDVKPAVLYDICVAYNDNMYADHRNPFTAFVSAYRKKGPGGSESQIKAKLLQLNRPLVNYLLHNNNVG